MFRAKPFDDKDCINAKLVRSAFVGGGVGTVAGGGVGAYIGKVIVDSINEYNGFVDSSPLILKLALYAIPMILCAKYGCELGFSVGAATKIPALLNEEF